MSDRRRQIAYGLFFILLAPTAAGGAVGVPLLQTLAALAVAPWREPWPRIKRSAPLAAAALALLIWIAAAAVWGDSRPEQVAKTLAGPLVGLAFVWGAFAVSPLGVRRLGAIVLACCMLLIAILAIEASTNMAINRLFEPTQEDWQLARKPAMGTLMLIVIGFSAAQIAASTGRVGLTVGLLILGAAAWFSGQFEMTANSAAFGFGLALACLALAAPRYVPAVVLAAGSVWVLAAPLTPSIAIALAGAEPSPSVQSRIAIWEFTAERIAEKPLLGWGFDASRTFTETIPINGVMHGAIPLHPHNMPLQIWLELGAVGAALTALLFLAAAWSWARVPRSRGAGFAAAGAIGAAYVYAAVSFGAWQEWWIATLFVAAMTVSVASRASALKAEQAPPGPPPRL